jgi:tripartite-type tricarboxylate transporter receptor subunit TctC
MTHWPYDAGSEAPYADLQSGAVDVYFDNVLACGPRIARGEVVPLAVSAAQRTELLPHVPTMIEQGYPGHVLEVWLAVFGAHLEAQGRVQLGGGPAESARLAARIESSRMAWTRALASASP